MQLDRFGKPFIPQNDGVIRLQDYADADLTSVDQKNAIWNKIKQVQRELAQAADAGSPIGAGGIDTSLYSRFWIDRPSQEMTGSGDGNDDNFSKINLDENDSTSTFTVAQFNTLARGLSSGPGNLFPTPFLRELGGCYGGFTSLRLPEVALDFDRVRKWRLLHVLLGGGLGDEGGVGMTGSKPAFDILALEEVDEYNSFFRQVLVEGYSQPTQEDGHCLSCYQGVFQPKPRSPCIPLGWYSDGVALLWNPEKFQTIAHPSSLEPWIEKGSFHGKGDDFPDIKISNQVYIIVPLQLKDTEKCVVVAATHLKAKKGLVNEQVRHIQASELRQRAAKVAEKLIEQGWSDTSIVIAGDFNSEPTEASVSCIISQEESNSNTKTWEFQSAYPLQEIDASPAESTLYTTWKTRKDGTTRRVIDYIFHASHKAESTGLRCTQFLSVPEDREVEQSISLAFDIHQIICL